MASSVEVFAGILRRHGVDPTGVTDVATAWRAFGEFLQVKFDGADAGDDCDADGFIIQWGRYSWTAEVLCLSLTRQFAALDDADYEEPEYCQIELQMRFGEAPDVTGLEELPIQDSGFIFVPAGPERTAELARVQVEMERYPPLRAILRATPVSSELTFYRAC